MGCVMDERIVELLEQIAANTSAIVELAQALLGDGTADVADDPLRTLDD